MIDLRQLKEDDVVCTTDGTQRFYVFEGYPNVKSMGISMTDGGFFNACYKWNFSRFCTDNEKQEFFNELKMRGYAIDINKMRFKKIR